MIPRLQHVVVVGAGTMGAQLACLLAGAGARVSLLDLNAAMAQGGLERARRARPSPFLDPEDLHRIRPAGLDALPGAVASADWILEAVVEDLSTKEALFEQVDAALQGRPVDRPDPLISTNTSGLSIAALAQGRSRRFRRRFLGTHFFNPPRYTRLLEVIPGPETDPAAIAWVEEYAGRHLGKGVVVARDTPAFIANRLGVHGLLLALQLATELGLGVDEVDELTGPLLGRPRSATFRTLDLVGLDVAVAVADHCHRSLVDDPERERFQVPELLRRLVAEGRLGEKTGAGFYRRQDGEILALDLATLDYRPRRRLQSAAVQRASMEGDLGGRVAALVAAARSDPSDHGAVFVARLLLGGLAYAARVGPQVADDVLAVDRAMRWGFGWELGPFELWDRLDPLRAADHLAPWSIPVPPVLEEVARAGGRFYGDGSVYAFATGTLQPVTPRPGSLDLAQRRRTRPAALPANAAATVMELGDGILGIELHGKLNLIGLDTIEILRRAIDLAVEAADGLVVGTAAADFSAGANLALLLMEAQEGEWDELERAVRAFQEANRALRTAPVPVVVLPRGRTLGGGAELALAADRRVALVETYIGLVEVGVGLIPAGGGTTAMARRVAAALPADLPGDRFPFFRAALETMGRARVAAGAGEARRLGFLDQGDLISADPDRQWLDGVRMARTLAETGYRPPAPVPIAVLGRRGIAAAEALTFNELAAGRMTEYDRRVVLALARVLAGGEVAEGTEVAEDHLLDLERETFLRLLGEAKTQERIRHLLATGRPLRN